MEKVVLRINVEDKLFTDYRFKALARILGNEWTAIGMCVSFWKASAKHWAEDGALMSKRQFEIEGFGPVLEVGLAEEREDGIWAKGTADYLDWARQRHEARAAGGKASAAARARKYGSANPRANAPKTDSCELPVNKTGTADERCGTIVNAHALVHAPALAPENENLILKHHHHHTRAQAVERDDGDDDWLRIDQTPLMSVTRGQIEPLGLLKLRRHTQLTPADINAAIRYFAFDVAHNGRFVADGSKIENPVGLLMSYLLSGGYPRPRNYMEVKGDGARIA